MTEPIPTVDPAAELARVRKRLAELEAADQRRQQVERQLATLLSNLPGMAYRCRNEPDWPMEFVSDGAQALTGYSAAELVGGRSFGDLIHAADRQTVWDQVQEAVRRRQHFQVVYRLHSAAGEEKWVWEQGQGIFATSGELLAIEGFITDITERKRVGLALRDSEERFRALVEKSHDVIALIDAAGQCLYISPSVTRVLGYTVDELVGGSSYLPVHPEDLEYAQGKVAEALAEPGRVVAGEVRYQHKDGSYRHIEGVVVNRLEDPNVQALVVNYRDVTDRKLAEETLRASEQHYRLLFERNLAGVFRARLDGQLTDCNDSFAEMLGYGSRDAILAGDDGPFYHPSERAAFLDLLHEKVVLTGHEVRFRRQDGGLVWALANVSLIMSTDGPIIEGTAVDITERKRMERELARERDFFRSLMDNTPLCIYFKDADSRFTRMNQASAANLGVASSSQAVGTSDFDYFPEDQALEYYADEQRLMQTGQPLIGKMERQPRGDGGIRWFLSTKMPIFNKDGQVTGLVGISTDISDQKRAEEALEKGLTLLKAVIEGTMDAVFVKDLTGRYVMINSAGAALIGRPVEQVVGRSDADLFSPAAARQLRADDLRIMETGERITQERNYKLGGGRRTFLVTQSPYRDHLGNIIGVIGVSHDITERKRLEEQLRQAQKMEAIGQLAGGVAHDFNNLLTAILGNVSLLSGSVPPSDPNHELLRDTEKAAARAAELTSQLLGFSRQTILRLEPVDVTSVIQETVGIVRRTFDPRVQVEVVCRPELWTVQADPGQLTQVLMNLCLNARDAMPRGGTLRLETAHAVLSEVDLKDHLEARSGEFVRLRVADTGQGIPADIRPRIFDPFFTTKGPGKGTGLGLAMVFGIVKQHQGWIECASEVGKGTYFDIYLPRHHARAAQVLPVVSPTPQGGSETILLVDDEAIIRNLGRTILQRYGYRVLLAEDGLEALQLYRQNLKEIDLVILDLVMPRLSGHDTLRQLLQIDPQVRVLFSSGYSAEQITESAADGVLGFVNKPYRPQELAQKVRTLLDEIQRQRQTA